MKYNHVKNFQITQNKTLIVQEWDNLTKVLERELDLKWIFLKFYLYNNPELKDFNLQTWDYYVNAWEKLETIIKTLKNWSEITQISLTILPWWNIFDIDAYLFSKWLIKKWDFINEAKNINGYKNEFSFLKNAITLEWFLYPDTHFVDTSKFNLKIFNTLLLKNFENKVYKKYLEWKTPEEIIKIINLASIVEKEERNEDEKPTVAWILEKRLNENWFIWADITACYAYSLTQDECRLNLSKYIWEKNDYNTRMMTWLPKTPIDNPQISSISAVINPKKTEYYYYLHDITTWKIYYARTNEEHNANKIHLK